MDQEAILAKLKETITPFLEEILRNGRVVVFYRTPKRTWGANTVFTADFLRQQARLMADNMDEGQTLEVKYHYQGYRWPEITFTVS